MKTLVTGVAGFIGYFVCQKLLDRGGEVIGIDNLNDYYDVRLKKDRLKNLQAHRKSKLFTFYHLDIRDKNKVEECFQFHKPNRVVHLAAQAGVRYSLENPHAYIDSNVVGFLNIIEVCRKFDIEHLVYASSSSVYGANKKLPFSVHDNVDHPLSLYAATKKTNELIAHSYSHLYQLPTTGLRFFTVYGPWGRPDMALFLFTKAIVDDEHVNIFNHGEHQRDFTYVEDIVEGVVQVLDVPACGDAAWCGETPDPATSLAPWRVYNIGNSRPVSLLRYVELLEQALGKKAKKNFLPLQPGDTPSTSADMSDLVKNFNYTPVTPVELGIKKFVAWYKTYYGIN